MTQGYDELVLARAIPFRTVCEHHLLPFSGVAHVGYVPGERILGPSKLARLVEHFAARPQSQENCGPIRAPERSSSPRPECQADQAAVRQEDEDHHE